MRAILDHILLLMLFLKLVSCGVTDLPKCCEDLQEHGEMNIGYHVAYDNASKHFIIHCGEEDGMTSTSDLVTSGARNCYELQQEGMDVDGLNIIYPYSSDPATPLLVYCDQTTDQGGWTVIQRRMDGRENFYRGWEDYENGFGVVNTEFWLGNMAIHELTEQTVNEIRIELEDWEGEQRYAHYKMFHIAGNSEVGIRNNNYQLSIAMYSGTAGDSLSYHHGEYFSTFDSDNDEWESDSAHCAGERRGAWWYGHCADSNLNGQHYGHGDIGRDKGVNWAGFHGYNYSLKKTSMKIRPFKDCDITGNYHAKDSDSDN